MADSHLSIQLISTSELLLSSLCSIRVKLLHLSIQVASSLHVALLLPYHGPWQSAGREQESMAWQHAGVWNFGSLPGCNASKQSNVAAKGWPFQAPRFGTGHGHGHRLLSGGVGASSVTCTCTHHNPVAAASPSMPAPGQAAASDVTGTRGASGHLAGGRPPPECWSMSPLKVFASLVGVRARPGCVHPAPLQLRSAAWCAADAFNCMFARCCPDRWAAGESSAVLVLLVKVTVGASCHRLFFYTLLAAHSAWDLCPCLRGVQLLVLFEHSSKDWHHAGGAKHLLTKGFV